MASVLSRHFYLLRTQRAKAFRGNPKDLDNKEVRGETKQFLVKAQQRNQKFKVVQLPHTPKDESLGRAWSDKMQELDAEFQQEFGWKSLLQMEAIDALPFELREHALRVDWSAPEHELNTVKMPWPIWLEQAANE